MGPKTLSVLWLLSHSLSITHASSLPLEQPLIIEILDGETFTLSVEYCAFTSYNANNMIVVSLNTRCFCFDTELNAKSIKFRTTPNSKRSTITKPLNTTNSALICDIPGPTIIVQNGIEFDINLVNNLIGSSYDTEVSYPWEYRNWPDVVNLHTHGLHVSPEWDNVFDPVNPQQSKLLHYEIPDDHYPGSQWYHSHFHQATELQIQGGLFGALLVETGTDEPNDFVEDIILNFHFMFIYDTENCDCDQDIGFLIGRYCYGIGFWELCSLCFNWCANPDERRSDSGFIYDAESIYADEVGKADLPLINGQFQPAVTIEAGKWYRFRLVNSNGQYYTQLRWPSNECEIYIIAADGVYFKDGPRDITEYPWEGENIFDPGSRNDMAIRCGLLHVGFHNVFYSQNSSAFSLLPRFPDNMLAFTIQVTLPTDMEDDEEDEDEVVVVVDENEGKKDEVKNVPNYVIPALPDYLYDSYNDEENSPYPITRECPCWTYPGGEYDLTCHWYLGRFGTEINGQNWQGPDTPILYVCKGFIYEFSVNSLHPLHIHTSPFQIMQDLPSDGQRIGFLAKAGDFRDTTSTDFGDFYIRYQATDFDGPIVTHCHFLPHEDEGMIVYFQVVDCIDDENRPFMDIVNNTLNPYGFNPIKGKGDRKKVVPDECDIFKDRMNV